ncbi:adenine specific DNA methyltransferase (plasmid) [Calothrix sp. NIES-4071]|nr:adenine specific DNA methyltransferase [Calothrix sp. NIES-4071]BAZ64938.1 adenine specific DNA methyltransferase [Calothrix sp. NIES-4105]
MTFTKENLRALATGNEKNRIAVLKELLGYPVAQRDPQSGNFWYLRPGDDEDEALETCPIAVGFLEELNDATDTQIKQLLTREKKQEIYGHYSSREDIVNQPVMYLLLPTKGGIGRIPLVLPTEGGLRQRQIQTFEWNDNQLIGRLEKLRQGKLPIAERAVCLVPQVDWVFYEPVKTASELARALAEAARRIEQAIPKVYRAEGKDGYLHSLLKSFQKELLPTLQLTSDNEKDYSFADIYAQTIAYGLFTARVFSYIKDNKNSKNKETDFNRQDAWKQLPETNPLLRQLFRDVSEQSTDELGEELIAAIADIFSILRAAKMNFILSDFQMKMNQEDIVIRFYEDFLAAYKPQMRERRGVYYTPEPVVSYMVRSVDTLLVEKFGKPLGLADPEVEILEPACGTGSFLLYIFRLIYERFHNIDYQPLFKSKVGNISWSKYVENHLLTRIYGFELLMAPYAIAHLKLSLFLEETGYTFESDKRLEIILSNTLDAPERKSEVLLGEYISEESDRAVVIKRDQPVMLVIGNPPYSYDSENTGEWITSLTRDYYQVDGQSLGEKNPKGLQDDYVKFIRFAQWKIEQTGQGILSFITNHGFLDNPTFKGMRQQLINAFDSLFIYDLHGNTKKKEKQPNGLLDSNVFDIQQGNSITFGIKSDEKINYHCHLWGSKEEKYKFLINNTISSTSWIKIQPKSPFYLFIPQNTTLLPEYNNYWKIQDIFPINSMGITTGNDEHFVAFNDEELQIKCQDITQSTLADYRPFDKRSLLYNHHLERARTKFMQHFIQGDNLALVTVRRPRNQKFDNFFVTDKPTDKCIISSLDNAQLFALYIYPNPNNPKELEETVRSNISCDFFNAITSKLGYTPIPEAIFYYIYAIFHSPTYRARYAEFLKIDFPCVPLTSNNELFCQLAEYGEELVALHLMKSPELDSHITKFVESKGNCAVDPGHPKYSNGAVTINKLGDKFTGVPEEVWNFYVGGYQVCQKWLKDRKGRRLSDEDIQHYQRIVVALKETIALMKKIDDAIPGFPIQ